jgi:hypothetical protein
MIGNKEEEEQTRVPGPKNQASEGDEEPSNQSANRARDEHLVLLFEDRLCLLAGFTMSLLALTFSILSYMNN